MKRSRIYLGVSTAVLAVAGIAATKAAINPVLIDRYYCTRPTQGAGTCVLTQSICTNNSGSHLCKQTIGSAVYTLYTINAVSNVLKCQAGGKCINPVKYVDEGTSE